MKKLLFFEILCKEKNDYIVLYRNIKILFFYSFTIMMLKILFEIYIY